MASEYGSLISEYVDGISLFNTDEISDYDRKVIVDYLNSKNSLTIIPSSITFNKIGEGNSGTIFKCVYNGINYGIKIYKNQQVNIPKIEIPESDYYIKTNIITNPDKTKFYGVFLYLKDYITLEKYINEMSKDVTHCYIIDMNRWTIIKNLITLIKNIHSINIYHRDIHPSNIMIHNLTLELKLIDMDTVCSSESDCKDELSKRYLQLATYKIKNFDIVHFTENSEIYSKDIDWYATGLICLQILLNNELDFNLVARNIRNLNNIELENYICKILINNIYYNCSIHTKIFNYFYTIILNDCFEGTNKYNNIILNYDEFIAFYLRNFYKDDKPFIIRADGHGLAYMGNNNLINYIIYHVFPNKKIRIDKESIYTDDKIDLLIIGTWIDQNKVQNIKCPYICLSIEPLRVIPYYNFIQMKHYPICEFNSLNTSINKVSPYDDSLYKFTSGNGIYDRYLIEFDNVIKSFHIPFLLFYYIGSINYNTESDLIVRQFNDLSIKKTHFMYIGSNCTNQIRETLFCKMKEADELYLDNHNRHARSLGKCQRTDDEKIFMQSGGNSWVKNMDIYSKSKFVFAIENSLFPGYITEKIMIVYQGGSIPIYWGPPEVKDIFNEETFYYLNDRMIDPNNPTEEEYNKIVLELYTLANDDSENGWKKYLNKPVYKNNIIPDIINYKNSTWIEEMINYIQTKYYNELSKELVGGKNYKMSYLKYKTKYLKLKNKMHHLK